MTSLNVGNIGSDIFALIVVRRLPEQKGTIIFRGVILARSGDADRIIPVRRQRTKSIRPISDLKGTLQKPCSARKNCHCRRRNRYPSAHGLSAFSFGGVSDRFALAGERGLHAED